MKRSLVALAALTAVAGAAHAQSSSVVLYGIVDAAVRFSNNEGVGKDSLTQMVGGGLSQARWGFRIDEDLGGGLRAVANLEQRFGTDDGTQKNVAFWSQGWVGLQSSSFGRVTLGRQYNVLFDIMTSTYSSFKFSPYIDTIKPESSWIGNGGGAPTSATGNLVARDNNAIKYALTAGAFTFEAQYSMHEEQLNQSKSYGAAAKYVFGPVGVGGGYIQYEDLAGFKQDVWTIGAGFTSGPFYANASYFKNEYDLGYGTGFTGGAVPAIILGTGLSVPVATRNLTGQVSERDAWMAGGTYNVTPAFLVGAQYWSLKQKSYASGAFAAGDNGKLDVFALLADYAFSKRTDAYIVFDHVKLKDGFVLNGTFASAATAAATGATKRESIMVGVRHRF